MSSLEKAMTTLTEQYYNAIVSQAGFDANTFQLVQGSQQVGNTSEQLWQFYDSVPPLSISQYFNPSLFNSYAQDYGGVIQHLIPQGSDALQNSMGDFYSQWQEKVAGGGGTTVQDFQQWAMSINPSQAATWISLYRTLLDGPIFLAQSAWDNVLNAKSNPGVFAYNKTISDLSNQLQSGKPITVRLNSNTESTDISKSWAKGGAVGIIEDFFGGGDASYQTLSESIATSGLDMTLEIQRLVTFASGPLSQPSQDAILKSYTPWYNSAALGMAYQFNNNDVWKHGAPTWDSTFGPTGNMLRVCSALAVIDGINFKMTSDANLSTEDQSEFKSAVSAGFWPFFEAEASGGWSTTTTFNDQGQASVTSSLPTGNPQVLGAIVTPISSILK